MILTSAFLWQVIFATLVTCITGTYIIWRLQQMIVLQMTGHGTVGVFAYIFWLLEALMFMSALLWFVDMLWTSEERERLRKRRMPESSLASWPTVDVLIPCCKEPSELVVDTVLAALAQEYPASLFTVYVCDDGGDNVLRDWTEHARAAGASNLRYLRRVKPKDRPHHAKAGNINHALGITRGDYLAILDADMITRPDFLRRMLAHFETPNIAFVQCPQSFYNVPDGDPLGHQAIFFYDRTQPHRDARHCAPSVGTGVVFRRAALEQIGGMCPLTITEDFSTTLVLQQNGWDTVYITDRLQFGLVPDDLSGTLRQRERWAIGTLQILAKQNPLVATGLKWKHRVVYLTAAISYIMPIFIALFSAIPVLSLFFDLSLMPVVPGNSSLLVILLVPSLIVSRLLLYVMYWGLRNMTTQRNRDFQQYLWMAPYMVVALGKFIIGGLRKSRAFKVTNAARKDGEKKETVFSALLKTLEPLKYVWYHTLYIIFAIAGLVLRGIVLLRAQKSTGNSNTGPAFCTGGFSLASQVLYVLINVQAMAPPILFLMFGKRWVVDRKDRLRRTPEGVPVMDEKMAECKPSRTAWLLEIVPAIWLIFYVAIFFGTVSGFTFGCSDFFYPPTPLYSKSNWLDLVQMN